MSEIAPDRFDITPEGAAMRLLEIIVWGEGKTLNVTMGRANAPDRTWLLDTYAECIEAVRGLRQPTKEAWRTEHEP